MTCAALAEEAGYVVAYAQGWADNPHPGGGFNWDSWNAVGTVESDQQKPGCYAWGGTSQYCYTSCAERTAEPFVGCDKTGCDWTTCVDSTTFNVALLDLLEDELCVDVTREYATGQSNGAIDPNLFERTLVKRDPSTEQGRMVVEKSFPLGDSLPPGV